LSWRFLAAVIAVAVLASGALLLQSRRSGLSSLDSHAGVESRRVDLVALVTAFHDSGFELTDRGRVRGSLGVSIQVGGESRQVPLFEGTPAAIECPELVDYGCVLLAQTLGDTVTWFALQPLMAGQQFRFELPPIVDLEDGYAFLDNGWELPYAQVIDRSCDPDVASFAEFLRKHGTNHRSVYDLRNQGIAAVECAPDEEA